MPENFTKTSGKIIVCDDDPDILKVITSMLKMEGYEAIAVQNSTQLYQAMDDHNPQLLIVDLWMPQLNGEDIIRKIKGHKEKGSMPILLLSASMVGDRVGTQAGADAFLSKPFEMEDLVNTVERLIKQTVRGDKA